MSVFAKFSNIFYEANKQLFVRAFVCAFYVANQQQKKACFQFMIRVMHITFKERMRPQYNGHVHYKK